MIQALETERLGKRYGRKWALRDCTFKIPVGCIAGLVGPNGAGKTTLLHLAVGLQAPSSGTVKIFGYGPARQTQQVLSMEKNLPAHLSGNLCLWYPVCASFLVDFHQQCSTVGRQLYFRESLRYMGRSYRCVRALRADARHLRGYCSEKDGAGYGSYVGDLYRRTHSGYELPATLLSSAYNPDHFASPL